jgi:phenylalanyl-tRNA synthetase beta chain
VFRDPRSATDPDRARTLTDEEVDGRTSFVIATMHERFGATVRGA